MQVISIRKSHHKKSFLFNPTHIDILNEYISPKKINEHNGSDDLCHSMLKIEEKVVSAAGFLSAQCFAKIFPMVILISINYWKIFVQNFGSTHKQNFYMKNKTFFSEVLCYINDFA